MVKTPQFTPKCSYQVSREWRIGGPGEIREFSDLELDFGFEHPNSAIPQLPELELLMEHFVTLDLGTRKHPISALPQLKLLMEDLGTVETML